MAATPYNLTIEQGIPFGITFTVKNENGSNKDLTGYTARMHFRPYPSSSVLSFEGTTENLKLLINTATSTCSIALTEADTTSLNLNQYWYDIELVSSLGVPLRLTEGIVTLTFQVTR